MTAGHFYFLNWPWDEVVSSCVDFEAFPHSGPLAFKVVAIVKHLLQNYR